MTTAKDRLTRFLSHLDSVFHMEPKFFPLEPTSANVPKVVCITYPDVPEAGHITGVTYGLSEVDHPEWRLGRPELLISVESTDTAWPLAVAFLANQLRGQCPFCYGDVVNFGERVAKDSEMSAFFVFAPPMLAKAEFLDIDVGGPYSVNIAGMYPIYDSERAVFAQLGLERFWKHPGFDPHDVRRARIEIDRA